MSSNILIYGSKHIRLWCQHYAGEPALCLGRGRRAFVIPLSHAYTFNEPETLFEKSLKVADALGLSPATKGELFKISEAIQHGLDALVSMPPESIQDTEDRERIESGVQGEGAMTIDGKTFEFSL